MSQQTKTSISTRTKFFDFLKPEEYEYDIEEIAHALSNLCRYTGHTQGFYSVAEHSVLVSLIVPSRLALCGLLHDASEAYCGDINKPLKAMLPEYCRIEDSVQAAIAKQFDLPYPFPAEVHQADGQLYWAERETVSKSDVIDILWNQENRIKTDVVPTGMDPKNAKAYFLWRYRQLTGKLSQRDKLILERAA